MMRNLLCAVALSVPLVTICLIAPAHGADSCQPVFDATRKIITSPSHSYSTVVMNGKPSSTEIIYVQGKTYMTVKGRWTLNPMTPNEVLQQEIENEKQGKSTCQFVRNESVNGEAATVYSMHRETETGKEDGLVWISKANGRALREEVEVDHGAEMGKSHLSARYEYSNVKPPM